MSFIKSLRKLNVVKFSYEVSHLHRDRYYTFCQISDRQVDQKVVQFLTLKVLSREDCDGEIVTEDGYDGAGALPLSPCFCVNSSNWKKF